MKKLILFLVLTLLPPKILMAQEHGHSGGRQDGGGNDQGTTNDKGGNLPRSDNGNNNFQTRGKNRAGNKPSKGDRNFSNGKNLSTNPGNKNHFNNGNHFGNGKLNNTPHHFNNAGGNGSPAPHHFKTANDQSFDDHSNNGVRGNHPSKVSPQLKKIGVIHVPQPIRDHKKILNADREHSTFTRPQTGPEGRPLHAQVIEPKGNNRTVIQNHMTNIVNNTTFTSQVNIYNNRETVTNHYYWHTYNGTNYCHYYDSWGYHWYGWYWGGSCFWTRWYGGNWWWYDPTYYRWCYWYDGGWWWQDPDHVNVVYVYNNDQYVPATTTETVETVDTSTELSYRSKDGTREVRIVGGDAFLYDTVEGETDNKPVYLGSNVKEVKFSNATSGKPLQIMLVLNDGSFELYDSDGNPYNGGTE